MAASSRPPMSRMIELQLALLNTRVQPKGPAVDETRASIGQTRALIECAQALRESRRTRWRISRFCMASGRQLGRVCRRGDARPRRPISRAGGEGGSGGAARGRASPHGHFPCSAQEVSGLAMGDFLARAKGQDSRASRSIVWQRWTIGQIKKAPSRRPLRPGRLDDGVSIFRRASGARHSYMSVASAPRCHAKPRDAIAPVAPLGAKAKEQSCPSITRPSAASRTSRASP